MRVWNMILGGIVAAAALCLLTFSGYFLWNSIPREENLPEVLSTDAIFLEEEPLPVEVEEPRPPVEEEPEPVPEDVPPEETEPAPAEEPVDSGIKTRLAAMTLEEKIWQLFIVSPEDITGVRTATVAGEATKAALEQYPVGGLCYFAPNLVDQQQVTDLLTKTQSYAKTGLFLCVDEEGGSVSRAGSNENLSVTHAQAAAQYGENADVAEVYHVGKTMAQELTALGFNVNFAPVADVITDPENTEIGDRAYSSDPQIAGALAGAMAEGLERNGMAACLKHFPGHGSTHGDSHEGTVISTRTLEELRSTEWVAFREAIDKDVSFVMLSHLTNENLSVLPASLSAEVVGYLRQELGFTGIVITDSQRMGAITNHYSSAEAAVLAMEAGADMILLPADLQSAHSGVLTAVQKGTIPESRIDESLTRILTVKLNLGLIS